jgi:alpha-D-xyloside xylohydrolase
MVVAASLCGAAPASAAVEIGSERITVSTDGARAVIQRAPLRIEFQDGEGRPVLRQLDNTRGAPTPGVSVEPEPLGTDNLADVARYQPLSFEVGGSASAQYPASSWVGNLIVGASSGVQHSAHDVLSATPEGNGVRLSVATSDPGRKLDVFVRPDPSGGPAIAVSAAVTPGDGVSAVADSFASAPGEAFRGFGGRHNSLDQRGNSFPIWVTEQAHGGAGLQPAADVLPGSGGDRYLFPNGPTAAYYNQTSFISSRGYGFFLEHDELSRYRLQNRREDAWQVATAAKRIDYTVAPGAAPKAIKTLTGITGRHRVPPEWAVGPTLYRGVRVLSPEADTPESHAAKVAADLDEIERRGLKEVTSYAIEGWDSMPREMLAPLVKRVRALGMHPMAYVRPYISRDAAGTERPGRFEEAVEKGYLATTAAGTPYLVGSTFLAGVAGVIDFTDPAAVDWWKGRIREVAELGFDGFMQDFGEQTMTDMHFDDGSTGLTMHNRYPVLYHRATREALDAYMKEHPDRELFFFTRAGFSGRPGSAAYENANFPGDEETNWTRSNGLAALANDMLSRGIGGAYGYTTDIGGYYDYITPAVTKELFIRWSQWAALSPIFRVHNSSSTGTKMPWSFDDETFGIWRAAAALHIKAKPLILKLWKDAQKTGIPPVRPLWLAFPGDEKAAAQDQQWMLGEDVLVAPVVQENARSREVYFPAGCWEHGETGERFTGPASRTVQAPLASLPWFERCGANPFKVRVAKSCVSRRAFDIRLPKKMRSARVRVDGRVAKVSRRGGRLVARVVLRGKPKAVVAVKAVGRDARGRRVVDERRYRTCVKRGR